MIVKLKEKLLGDIPVTREELIILISSHGRKNDTSTNDDIIINKCEPKECYDLSNLDVSKIDDMSLIFVFSMYNGDLSKWDISNVKDMYAMFWFSELNNDSLKDWNTSNVTNMNSMFESTVFNGDLSKWDISNVETMIGMFCESTFNGDISFWKFYKHVNCDSLFDDNKNFENKYNSGKDIPNDTNEFLEWFENNKEKMKNINTKREEILDFFSFENYNLENKL